MMGTGSISTPRYQVLQYESLFQIPLFLDNTKGLDTSHPLKLEKMGLASKENQ